MSQTRAQPRTPPLQPAGPGGLDAAARFELLYRTQVDTITAYFARRSFDPQTVADLTADTFVQAMVPVRAGCPSLSSVTVQIPLGGQRPQVSVSASGHDGQVSSVTVDAKGVPADETMVLAFDGSHDAMFGASGFVKGKVPSCVSLPTPPVESVPGSGSGGRQGSTNG